MSRSMHVAIIEPSSIIREGLNTVVSKLGMTSRFLHLASLGEIEKFLLSQKPVLLLVNPAVIQNNLKAFDELKADYPKTRWIAVVYAIYDPQLLSLFDSAINIYDSLETISNLIRNVASHADAVSSGKKQETLTDRETGVLKLMAAGLSNKEIADKLNISINTVITHRKNISIKTGIKSISGLTIYAVVKKLITLDNLQL